MSPAHPPAAPLRVAHYPCGDGNPYQALLFAAAAEAGVECLAVRGGVMALLRQVLGGPRGALLHLHWVSEPAAMPRLAGALARVAVLQAALALWRLRGGRIVWTVHNLHDHERRRPWLDRLNTRAVARASRLLLVHGAGAVEPVARAFGVPPQRLRVVPHGNYRPLVQALPPPPAHAGLRLLFFGQIRRYKGLPRLLEVFRALDGPHWLRIAGSLVEPVLGPVLRAALARDERVVLHLGHQSDEALATHLAWCDLVVLPYEDILTSGSLLMALSAGRAVVAPRLGLVIDHADEATHFLYDADDAQGLAVALARAAQAGNLAARGARAGVQADRFDWAPIGRTLAALYREVAGRGTESRT